jgi:quercetin dioxygenase-like cupin family protein
MQQDVVEAELKSAGYTEIEARTIDPRPANAGHAHDYDIRGLVLDGIFVVIRDGKPETYRAGDVFAVPAGKSHPRRSACRARGSSPAANISGKL